MIVLAVCLFNCSRGGMRESLCATGTRLSVLRIVGQWLWKTSEMITEKEVETKPVTLQHFRVRISHGVPWSSTCTLLFVYFIHLQVHSDKNIKLFTSSLNSVTITTNSFFVTFTFFSSPCVYRPGYVTCDHITQLSLQCHGVYFTYYILKS